MQSVYLGIDVACASGKRLPICVVSAAERCVPLVIPKLLADLIPRGLGNREISSKEPFQEVADQVATAIKHIMLEMDWRTERIAIDAPAAPAEHTRKSEDELCRCRLSCYRTPSTSAWQNIRRTCINHLSDGGSLSTLPHANKIWMLFGFELFSKFRHKFNVEVMETYPFAVVRTLLASREHKTTEKGYRDQLGAVAERTNWEGECLESKLKLAVRGSRHDRLDAFMAAWIASLPREKRRSFGNPEHFDDAIWVPR